MNHMENSSHREEFGVAGAVWESKTASTVSTLTINHFPLWHFCTFCTVSSRPQNLKIGDSSDRCHIGAIRSWYRLNVWKIFTLFCSNFYSWHSVWSTHPWGSFEVLLRYFNVFLKVFILFIVISFYTFRLRSWSYSAAALSQRCQQQLKLIKTELWSLLQSICIQLLELRLGCLNKPTAQR